MRMVLAITAMVGAVGRGAVHPPHRYASDLRGRRRLGRSAGLAVRLAVPGLETLAAPVSAASHAATRAPAEAAETTRAARHQAEQSGHEEASEERDGDEPSALSDQAHGDRAAYGGEIPEDADRFVHGANTSGEWRFVFAPSASPRGVN